MGRKRKAYDDPTTRKKIKLEPADVTALKERLDRGGDGTLTGTRGDGNFYARFVNMGQGDCIVLATPAGKTVVVDCGSSRTDDGLSDDYLKLFAYHNLFADRFLSTDYPQVDILILTHCDKDHFNKLDSVMKLHDEDVSVVDIYHSRELHKYGKGARDWIQNNQTGTEWWVVCNEDSDGRGSTTLRCRTPNDRDYQPYTIVVDVLPHLDPDGGIRIHTEADCTITILASGVDEDYAVDGDTGDGNNRASVVTLVEVFGKKLLLCGDATRSTEEYLMTKSTSADKYETRLSGVDVVHVAHHGSGNTSSSDAFVKLLAPKDRALISAGKVGDPAYGLPSRSVVQRYHTQFQSDGVTAPAHDVWSWPNGIITPSSAQSLTTPVYSTGSIVPQPLTATQLDITWTKPA
ncbi:ComEC/Rec2 family competence protein [Micromonospora sp. SH-82]|uniref:ComEC/Rec2 family competence protein n=1 Tax=Micromonospora sp. SH-82 TaxID=3132938 RepID=UPI003EB81601